MRGLHFTLGSVSPFCSAGGQGEGERGEKAGQIHTPPYPVDSSIFERSQYEKQSDVTCPQTSPDQHNQGQVLHLKVRKARVSRSPPAFRGRRKTPSLFNPQPFISHLSRRRALSGEGRTGGDQPGLGGREAPGLDGSGGRKSWSQVTPGGPLARGTWFPGWLLRPRVQNTVSASCCVTMYALP